MSAICTPLSPKTMENNYCFYCKKYLSYGPIKVYPSGNISCGRCSRTEVFPGTVSLYEKVAPYLVFPCIYQPQGCSLQLRYDEVKDHENICSKGKREFHCPSCPVKLGYTDSFLRKVSNHFENIHVDDILKKPEFFLNINNFDTTERNLFYSKKESLLCMLMFVKFDGQWLYINVSVPYGYSGDKFRQVVTNLNIPKYCSSLGDNSDCFKFFLPRMLDCIAKIDFNIVGESIRVTLSFLPKEIRPDDVPRIKTKLDPPYIPDLYWDNDLKKLQKNGYGEIDFDAFSLNKAGNKIKNIKNGKIILPIKCDFCDFFMWELSCTKGLYHSCAHYNICNTCFFSYCGFGYNKCGDDFDKCIRRNIFPVEKQLFQALCHYGCGSYIDILKYKLHEKFCKFNILRFLSESEMGKLCFGLVFQDNSTLHMHKSIIVFNFKYYEPKSSCYIVTNRNQKFILHYTYTNGVQFFEVEHEYDKITFTADIQIICKGFTSGLTRLTHNTIKEEKNCFYGSPSNSHYISYSYLKETTGDLTFSIKIVNRNEIFKKLKLGSEVQKKSDQKSDE